MSPFSCYDSNPPVSFTLSQYSSGLRGLVDESRRPLTAPLETSREMVEEVIRVRQAHPSWGARKLHKLLERLHGAERIPSLTTVSRVLERAGFIRKRRRRPLPHGLATAKPSTVVQAPNDLWTVDFKGWWRTGDGQRCNPLTVRDALSRYVLAVQLVPDMKGTTVRREFERLFARHGVPKAIQSDNGQPFVSPTGIAGMTTLSAWWMSLGIERVLSRPACPQDNGSHERMHKDMRCEIQAAPAANLEAQQRVCDTWRTEFNHVRPHQALGMRTPSEVYRASRRKPVVRREGLPEDCQKRVIDDAGFVRYDIQHVYVAGALAGHTVGLRREGRRITVWFYELQLGWFVVGEHETVQPEVSVKNGRRKKRRGVTDRQAKAEVSPDGVTSQV
jgi:transposase InsO family protein